jgi:hypothetical protein
MARVASRIYVPLDVNFFDDDKVLAAGEAAAWLYLNMCARAKLVDNDGVLTRQQIERLGVRGFPKRLAALVANGLVTETITDLYFIEGWLNWNESKAKRQERLKAERDRKKGGRP